MTSDNIKIKKAFPDVYDQSKLTREFIDYLSADFKNPPLYRKVNEKLKKARKYSTTARNKGLYYKTKKDFVICSKCRYPFSSRGFHKHVPVCDGTGPKDTSFRQQVEPVTNCKFCDKDLSWMSQNAKNHHIKSCENNPDREIYLEVKRSVMEYSTWCKNGSIPNIERTYIYIRKYLKKEENKSEEDIEQIISDMKRGIIYIPLKIRKDP